MGESGLSKTELLKEIHQLRVQLRNLGNKEATSEKSKEEQDIHHLSEFALHFAPIAVFLLKDGYMFHPNLVTENFYGLTAEDLVSKPFIDFVAEDDRPQVINYLNTVKSSGRSIEKCTHRIQSEEENSRWFELTAIRSDNKQDNVLICYQSDVSKRFQLKENFNMYSEHLEETVNLRTNELQKALEKAEIANLVKDNFLQNMSHEFRTPIHHINSFSEIGFNRAAKYLRENPDPFVEKLQDYFLDIHNASKNLFSFILNLFNLSALESGDIRYHFVEYDISEILKVIKTDYEDEFASKEIKLEISKPEEPVLIECDFSRLKDVFDHLLNNTVKFCPQKSIVKITLKHRTGNVSEGHAEAINIRIEDQGMGVPEEELEMIFDKFTQSSRTDDGSGGKGIGLAICKIIIKDHHGRIWAENRDREGLVINIDLPYSHSSRITKDKDKNQDINKITF